MKIKVVCRDPDSVGLGKYYLGKVVRSWTKEGRALHETLGHPSPVINSLGLLEVTESLMEDSVERWAFGKAYTFEETTT